LQKRQAMSLTLKSYTDSIRFTPIKRIANFFVYIGIRFWMWYGFIRPVNAAARHFGVKEYKPVFNFFKGDITLVAEPAGFSGMPLPENHYYIGPLLANQDFPIPDEVMNIPRDMPLVYFAMGSSGTATVVAQIIESFNGAPYRVVAPVKQLIKTKPGLEVPPNVLVTDWLPALQVSRMADISVIPWRDWHGNDSCAGWQTSRWRRDATGAASKYSLS
jgi:hypothetical protein